MSAKPKKKKKPTLPPRPVGRPIKTLETAGLPENWKEIILDMSKEGASDVEIRAALCGTSIYLWYALQEREEEFSEIIKIGRYLHDAWWLKQGRTKLEEPKFNYTGWYHNMKNRCNWSDKTKVTGELTSTLIQIIKTGGEDEALPGPKINILPPGTDG